MAEKVTLAASPRTERGKGAARKARAQQQIPAVIYGRGREPQSLVLDAKALDLALQGIDPSSTLIDLTVDGKPVKTLIREIQRHPVRYEIMHVDFFEIHAGELIKLSVAVHLTGIPDGVRNGGGVLDQVTREVELEVTPDAIPDRIELDVTDLAMAQSLHVSDLDIPNAKLLTDPGNTLCTVVPPRVEEVETPVAEEEAAEAEEPELIRKPKPEEGEEGETEGDDEAKS